MDAMEAVNFLATEYLFRQEEPASSSVNEALSHVASETLDAVMGIAEISTKAGSNSIMTATAVTQTPVATTASVVRSGTVMIPPSLTSSISIPTPTSDFILKRIAKSVGFKVAKKLADSGAPDRHIASIISYLVSPFALLCMGMAIILNRTVVFATTRRPVPLPLIYRVILRSIAIYTLAAQTIPLIRALACSDKQFGNWVLARSLEDNGLISGICRNLLNGGRIGNGGDGPAGSNPGYDLPGSLTFSLLYAFSPWRWIRDIDFSWWSSVPGAAVPTVVSNFQNSTGTSVDPQITWLVCPGPEILWDLYRSICIGHFIETFTSVIQGRIPYSETGMTLFEYSVAFQEVQSSQQLSTEILIVSIISSFSQLAFHVQGMLNSYKYRLIPSSIFGVSFLSYFAYAVFNGRLLYFPSVCVIGYVPQLAVSIVVLICGVIYGLACLFTGGPSNMQTSLQSIHIEMTEDFYSCLMKLGVIALTSATKATYLTEARSLCAPLATWIEYVDDSSFANNSSSANSNGAGKNPYDIEVVGPPNENGYIRAKKLKSSKIDPRPKEFKTNTSLFKTMSRVISAFRMVQALFTITIYMIWKLISIIISKIMPASSRQESAKDRAEEFEVTLMAVRNNFIYADLNDEYENGYLTLLNGETLPDIDDSKDYDPDQESENEEVGYEFESDYSSDDEDINNRSEYISNAAQLRVPVQFQEVESANEGTTRPLPPKKSSITEFYDLVVSTPDYFLSLLAPKTSEEAEEVEILSRHLSTSISGPLTRSKYHDSNQHNDLQVLLQVLKNRRKPKEEGDENDNAALRSTVCVVCQSSPRQVVLWPCRCFALCEECRVALAFKHFKGCVCCRREVESFSRVFIP